MEMWVVAEGAACAALVAGARGVADTVNAVSIGGGAVPGAAVTVVAPAVGPDALVEGYARPVADLLAARSATVVLFGSDQASRLLAGLVAAHLRTSVRNATRLRREDDTLLVERATYGGMAVATDQLGARPAVVVVGAGALPEAAETLPEGQVDQLDARPETPGLRVVELRPKQASTVDLTVAKRVVSVGRGFAAEADLGLARDLAAKLDAELACSRPVAEGVHWLPVERYVGVSGATIRPDVYVAVGVSGQVQHMVGARGSKVIVAINKDKNAPVFAYADYGIVGDLYQVLPALTQAL